jgi:hypothetical protein
VQKIPVICIEWVSKVRIHTKILSVGIADNWRIMIRFSIGLRDLYILYSVQTVSGSHLAYYKNNRLGQSDGGVKQTTPI